MNEGTPIPAETREIPGSGIVVVYHYTYGERLASIMNRGLVPDFGGDWEYSRGLSQDGGPVRYLNNVFNDIAVRMGISFTRTECVFANLERHPARFPGVNIALSVRTDSCYVADKQLFDRCLDVSRQKGRKFRRISEANAATYWDKMVRLDRYLMNQDGFEDPEVLLPNGKGVIKMQIVEMNG